MKFDTIILEKKDSIATITMNRPDKMNACNQQMFKEIDAALTDIENDDQMIFQVVSRRLGYAFDRIQTLLQPDWYRCTHHPIGRIRRAGDQKAGSGHRQHRYRQKHLLGFGGEERVPAADRGQNEGKLAHLAEGQPADDRGA